MPATAGEVGPIPVSRRSPGVGNGNQLQYPGLENPMDRGAWWAIVHGVAKSQTWLSTNTHTHTHTHTHSRIIYWQCICHGQMKSGEANWKHEEVIAVFLFWPFTYIHHMMNKSLRNGLSERRAIILGSKREGFTTRVIKWLFISYHLSTHVKFC